MFTGIIEEVGRVAEISESGDGRDLAIRAHAVMEDLRPGDSIAVEGVCQTVISRSDEAFRVHAIATTLSRTTLGELEVGRAVNLERPLTAGGRFGGHFVQGHVDAVAVVSSVERHEEMVRVRIELPESVRPYTVLHGSIAVDGVSLTVNRLDGGTAEVALIPYTYEHTSLARLTEGCRVNLEADLIGKYVVGALDAYRAGFAAGRKGEG